MSPSLDLQTLPWEGGPFLYLVGLLALLGMAVGAVQALVASLGRWIPAAGWLAMPSAVRTAGAWRQPVLAPGEA